MNSTGITARLAAFAARSSFESLPRHVQAEGVRAFVNWMGCVLGGCLEPSVDIALGLAGQHCGHTQSTIVGRGVKSDMASAALVNCLSSAALAFDDTHLATVTHPTGPVAAALLAFAENHQVSGRDFVNALVVGIELQCRMSNVLVLPPARSNAGLYVTGLTGPIGTAAAVGRLMGLDEQRMTWAIGLAAAQASGIRAVHGSMAGALVPALAARSGLTSALLAESGFTCSTALETPRGFVDVYAPSADLSRAVDRLGEHFETLANAYKPYPCGIVIHPTVDACLDLAAKSPEGARPEALTLRVHPLALELANRAMPENVFEAQVSLQHWAACALLRRTAGVAEARQSAVDDPNVAALRQRISIIADPAFERDEAEAEMHIAGGKELRAYVPNARGSLSRPLSDGELDAKFITQAQGTIPERTIVTLLRRCRAVTESPDVGSELLAGLQRPHRRRG